MRWNALCSGAAASEQSGARQLKRDLIAQREFLPTDLPTANGSYSPFQRLGSSRRERKSLIICVCLDCHGRGRGFESRRPRHIFQTL